MVPLPAGWYHGPASAPGEPCHAAALEGGVLPGCGGAVGCGGVCPCCAPPACVAGSCCDGDGGSCGAATGSWYVPGGWPSRVGSPPARPPAGSPVPCAPPAGPAACPFPGPWPLAASCPFPRPW